MPAIKSALQSDGDLEIASIAAGDGDDATVLCRDGRAVVDPRRRAAARRRRVRAPRVDDSPPRDPSPRGRRPPARARRSTSAGAPRESALVVTSGGGAALFAGSTLQEQLLLHDPAAGGGGVLAAAPAPELGGWLLLTELMGVVAYAPTAPAPPSPIKRSPSAGAAAGAAGFGPEPDALQPEARGGGRRRRRRRRGRRRRTRRAKKPKPAVRNEFAAYVAGHGAAPSECGFRLRAAGALGGSLDGTEGGDVDGGVGAFAACSRAIVDALPKHWPGPDGPGPGVELHLDEKARRHDVFLRFLVEASGVWQLLAASEREAILEHGEMVSALLCVRSLHNEAAEMAETGADRERGSDALALLLEAATTAGAALQASDAAVRGRPAVEVCYSRATGAADALLPALADGLERHAGARARASLHERAAALDALSRALLGALSSASDFRRHHASLYPPAGAGAVAPPPRWNAGEGARMALTAAADAAAALRDEAARGGAPDLASPLGSQLYALAAPLLDATAAHVASAPLGSAERAMARDEYARAQRASVLPALMNAARASDGGFGGFASGDFASGPFAVTMDAVAAVAEAHFGYEQLAEVCETAMAHAARVGDGAAIDGAVARTHHHMRTLRGAAEDGECTFATFMFHRMMTNPGYHSGVGARVAEMLQDTPDEFYGELGECLKPHPPLLWLHQLRADDYVGAAGTLHGLSVSGASGGGNASVREQAQYLSLAKLSLLAGGAPADADDVVAIDAALDLAKIQSALSARRKVGSADRVVAAVAAVEARGSVPRRQRERRERRRPHRRVLGLRVRGRGVPRGEQVAVGGVLATRRGGDGLERARRARGVGGGRRVRPRVGGDARRESRAAVLRPIVRGTVRPSVRRGHHPGKRVEAVGGGVGRGRGERGAFARGFEPRHLGAVSDGSEHEKIEREYCTLFISDVYYKRDKRLLTLMIRLVSSSRDACIFFFTRSRAPGRGPRGCPRRSRCRRRGAPSRAGSRTPPAPPRSSESASSSPGESRACARRRRSRRGR